MTIYGAGTGSEATQLEASWSAWAKQQGITIKYTGDKNFSTDWTANVTSNGKMYGTPLDASVKGHVWYSPKSFAKWGVSVPKTYDELLALTDTIQKKTGNPPWCAGVDSGDASGWPGADQLAEVVLADVATPLANGTCALTNQATFLKASFATAKTASGATPTVGPDGDIWAFPLPGPTAGQNAVIGGGDFAAAFDDNAATQKVMEYLSSADWANSLLTVKNASFISANKGVDAANEKDPLLQSAIKILRDPSTTFRFGADDAMPNVVETAFWKGMIDWINGTSQAAVEKQIQASWPAH